MKIHATKACLAMCICSLLFLVGCAIKPQTLYQWEDYQTNVYSYLNGESPEEQIASLEKGLEKIHAAGTRTPPGYHAQLGMLYARTGNSAAAEEQFNKEKKLFPEATTYMNFLLKKNNKKASS